MDDIHSEAHDAFVEGPKPLMERKQNVLWSKTKCYNNTNQLCTLITRYGIGGSLSVLR